MHELRPCPLCECTDVVLDVTDDEATIACMRCGIQLHAFTPVEARFTWNSRPRENVGQSILSGLAEPRR